MSKVPQQKQKWALLAIQKEKEKIIGTAPKMKIFLYSFEEGQIPALWLLQPHLLPYQAAGFLLLEKTLQWSIDFKWVFSHSWL